MRIRGHTDPHADALGAFVNVEEVTNAVAGSMSRGHQFVSHELRET